MFHQDLSSFDVSRVTNMNQIFMGSRITAATCPP